MRSPRLVLSAVGAVAILVMLAAAAPAAATCLNEVYDEPLPPITSITPAANASFEQSYVYPVRFTVISPIHFAGFSIRVSSRPQMGQTGILSDLVGLDDTILTESATDPDYYFGQSSFEPTSLTTWMYVPGTYYWQLFGEYTEGTFTCHAFAGPINTITITPSPASPPVQPPVQPPPIGRPPSQPLPQPPTISLPDAKRYAAVMIRERTHRRPSPLRVSCSRIDSATLECSLRFSEGSDGYVASGSFSHQSSASGRWSWSYDFKVLRVWETCRRRRHCAFHHSTTRWRSSGRPPL